MEITNVILTTVKMGSSTVNSIKSFADVVKAQEYYASIIRQSRPNLSDDEFDEALDCGYFDMNGGLETVHICHSNLDIKRN